MTREGSADGENGAFKRLHSPDPLNPLFFTPPVNRPTLPLSSFARRNQQYIPAPSRNIFSALQTPAPLRISNVHLFLNHTGTGRLGGIPQQDVFSGSAQLRNGDSLPPHKDTGERTSSDASRAPRHRTKHRRGFAQRPFHSLHLCVFFRFPKG